MVSFRKEILDNGLRVLVHEDKATPMVSVNILYDVGSRDENPEKTGFAHLFEHLMFAGSKHAPDFDTPMQNAGGENNAYTTNDYTTFYEILPKDNLETALWLESDRMLALNISKKTFEVQRRVVLEEFKETCLNEPYGDFWHHLSKLMYDVHPYRWPTIGLVPEHIENAVLADVRDFYERWYGPSNAVLSIAGNIETDKALLLAQKWFGNIPARATPTRQLPVEPPLGKARYQEIKGDVPATAIYLAFRTPARLDPDFYPVDLLSDILAQGHSSRLYRRLLKEQRLFSSIDAYLTANTDPGLFVVEGKPAEGVSVEKALEAIWGELRQLCADLIAATELQKIQRRFESTVVFSELSVMNKAQHLGFYESLQSAHLLNDEVALYLNVTPADMQRTAQQLFRPENSATLVYYPEKREA